MAPFDLDDQAVVDQLVARCDDPWFRQEHEAARGRVRRWAWTRDDVVTTAQPFAAALGDYRVPRWADAAPAKVAGWCEFGFDEDDRIVLWRWRDVDSTDVASTGARFVVADAEEMIELTIAANGEICQLVVETLDRDGHVVATADISISRSDLGTGVATESTEIWLARFDYDGIHPVAMHSARWVRTSAAIPPELSADDLAESPWSVLEAMLGQWHCDLLAPIRASYDHGQLAQLIRCDEGSDVVVWNRPGGPPADRPPTPNDAAVASRERPLEDLEDDFAAALADATAADASAHPVAGLLCRVVLRWHAFEQPGYFTVHLLGTDDGCLAASGEEAWLPLEWEKADRELERSDRIAGNPAVADAAELAAKYEAMVDAELAAEEAGEATAQDDQPGGGASRAIWETIRRLPDALARHGVALDPTFAATATHFEGFGGLDILRDTADPAVLAGLEARGELPLD